MSSEQHAESILDETVPSAYLRHGDAAKEQPEPAFPELIHHAEKRDQPSAQTTSSGSGTVVSPAARAGPKESDNEKSNQRASSESSGGSSPSSPPPLQLARSDTLNRQTSVDSYGNTYPEGGLRAWLVVYGSFSGMTASFGLMNTIGTYQAYLSTHQLSHLDESTIGWIFSIYTFMAFFCGVQIGPVFDAKGPRLLVLAGTLCMVGGTLGIAESTELWHFILSFSLAAGLGTSLIFTPAIGSIAHFFLIRRASATGLATTGGSIGGIIFPLMLQRLFPHVGFRWATRILAFIFLFQLIVANILIRSRLPPPPKGSPATSMWPDWRIFKNLTFCLTTAGTFFVEWALFVPLTYITSYSIAHGISPSFSYQLLAVL
ncbi:uncharacterized protein KY384_001516 [Bacidia gigantensis]|uniref:uncharacterized protein n=1 Tax=Bacidia gigantensis TaxID=2732470 RepID=UPI001D049CAD|nr:uncharacterized protein KY384_001516 [Bacidia gigantensis]KAG8533775.1 hypothetical protein KY384_001516 [Bacidia gigantensis]